MAVASDRSAAASGLAGTADGPFEHLMAIAQKQLDDGALAEGLLTLSRFYGDPKLTPDQTRRLTGLLDQLAGTVIYSRQPLLGPPHPVQPGETLDAIAQKYSVPARLLAKINGIGNPAELTPGQELKVIQGPFHAVIDLDDYELTLMVQGRYAGRFRIGIGGDQPNLEGAYQIKDKTENPTYYGRDAVVDADDPENPLGERWIGLASPGGNPNETARVGIHGTNDPLNVGTTTDRGSICLGDRDAEDIYDILSIGSRVVIRR
jgi:LysM repeat protein